jgi:phage terminase small subunit
MKPLTPKQEKFAQLVAEGKNQSDAYRGAYKAGKMMAKTITEKASVLMAQGNVSARVAQFRKEVSEKSVVSQETVIKELQRIAFFDIRKLFNVDGTLKRVTELDDDTAAAIASIEVVDIGADGQLVLSKKFKTSEKLKALDLIGTHLGMFVKKVEDVTDPLKKAMGRMTPSDAQAALDALEQVRAIRTKAKVSDER